MLTITPQASEALRVILDSDEVPEDAVVRLSTPVEDGTTLAIEIVEAVPDGDQRVEGEDIEVSVDPGLASALDDKELDAFIAGGQVNFTIGDQGGNQAAQNAHTNGGQPADETSL